MCEILVRFYLEYSTNINNYKRLSGKLLRWFKVILTFDLKNKAWSYLSYAYLFGNF